MLTKEKHVTACGPFETAAEARAAAHAIIPPGPDSSVLDEEQNRAVLERVCEITGVDQGAWDRRVVGYLAIAEDSLCGSVAGMITRAYEAGKQEGGKADG